MIFSKTIPIWIY